MQLDHKHPLEFMVLRLVERTQDDGWDVRLAMFKAGLETIAMVAARCQGQRRRAVLRECSTENFARGIIEALGVPHIVSGDQAELYALSDDPRHQAMARDWWQLLEPAGRA